MTDNTSLLTFPCEFTIKIIGVNTPEFLTSVHYAVLKHYPTTPQTQMVIKPSKEGNYTAISATVTAKNQPGLDALYHELTTLPGIKMVL